MLFGKSPNRYRALPFLSCLVLTLLAIRPAWSNDSILLLGNSFTGYTFEQISARDKFGAHWAGGYNLDQHFNDENSRNSICAGHKFVVLQDFSTRALDPELFQFDMDEMIPFVRSCEAEPVLFMTWETISISYLAVSSAHQQAAAKHDVQIVPIGTVFHRIRMASEAMYQSLLQEDGKHPSVRGSKVAAACLMKAFCEECFNTFDWRGFNGGEIALVTSLIESEVDEVVAPILTNDASRLPSILLLLLDT